MVTKSKNLGKIGEEIAVNYLKKEKKYKILERNFRYKNFGEIDIIAQNKRNKEKPIIFVEVKTRNINSSFSRTEYFPEDNITYFKRKQLIKLSRLYLGKNNLLALPYQIDIIGVVVSSSTNRYKVQHLEQAIEDIN